MKKPRSEAVSEARFFVVSALFYCDFQHMSLIVRRTVQYILRYQNIIAVLCFRANFGIHIMVQVAAEYTPYNVSVIYDKLVNLICGFIAHAVL